MSIIIYKPTWYYKQSAAMAEAYNMSKIAPSETFYVTRWKGKCWVSEVPPNGADGSELVCKFTDGMKTVMP